MNLNIWNKKTTNEILAILGQQVTVQVIDRVDGIELQELGRPFSKPRGTVSLKREDTPNLPHAIRGHA
jgi:hypothetical protein